MSIVSITLTLLVILSALYFLAKVKADNLGPLFKWTAYLVLIVAGGLLMFQIVRGSSRMWNRKMHGGKEQSGSMHHCHANGHGSKMDACCVKMECCHGKGKMQRKRMRMNNEPGVIRNNSVDTIDGKIIVKETEIIEKRKE